MAVTSFDVDERTAALLVELQKTFGVKTNAAVLRKALAARAQFTYAEEHLDQARQIIRTHAPDRPTAMPTVEAISAERVIEDARSERMAREARKRREAASDPDGSQRAKRRAMGHWRSNAGMVRFDAALMTDAELAWFSTIDQARKNADDALRLRDLRATLLQRSSNQRLQQWEEERRGNAERLKRLGLSDDGREGGAAA